MLENLYGTFTFGLIIASIATLVGFVIFQYILWPILKLILTPMIGGALIIGEFFGKAFEKKGKVNEDKNSISENSDSFANKFANNYLSITSIFVVLPFIFFIICIENLIIHKKYFTLDLNIFIDTFFAIFGLVVYGVAISFGLKTLSKDNYKFYVPFIFLFMAFFIIRDKFF